MRAAHEGAPAVGSVGVARVGRAAARRAPGGVGNEVGVVVGRDAAVL